MARLALAAALALCALPSLAAAECRMNVGGAHCISIPARPAAIVAKAAYTASSTSASTPLVNVGDVVPRGRYSILLNADYYGLPPVSDGWVYMRIGHDAYRVDWRSQQVLERVTDEASANF